MPNMSAHDAAIYAANDLIMALTKPQPTNSFISIGDDQIVALQKIGHHFSILHHQTTNFSSRGARHCTPQHPRTRSQTKKFANAALTSPQGTTLLQTQPQQTVKQKQEEDLFPEPPIDIPHHNKPRIIPIIANL